MASGFSGEFPYGAGGGGGSSNAARLSTMSGIGGNPAGVAGFRQQQQQQQMMLLQQQQQQGMGMGMQSQIQQRKMDFLGKRNFGDYQSSLQQQQQQQHLVFQQQQQVFQQQGMGLSYMQKPVQEQQQLQQYLMRSVKPRNLNHINSNINSNNSFLSSSSPLCPTIDLTSPTHNHHRHLLINNNHPINNNHSTNNSLNSSHNIVMNNSSSSTRFGVPVYQQPRHPHLPILNAHQFNPTVNTLNNNNINIINNSLIVPNLANPVQNPGFQPRPDPVDGRSEEVKKVLNTLEEIEQLLLADVDDVVAPQDGEQPVSGVTDSVWSDLVNPSPSPTLISNLNPSPSPVQASASTSCSNNNNNNNCNSVATPMISPSPTSSTSSCCSTSASASPPAPTPPTAAASAKQLISEAATAISEGKSDAAMEALAKLGQIADAKGNSEQRLAFYICNALKCRACPAENPPPIMELFTADQMASSYALYDISPCFKFGLLAANLVMLEAITSALQEGVNVHVIDFDVGPGGQYINLLRALAERKSQPLSGVNCADMRITVVQTEVSVDHPGVQESVKEVLVKLAQRVGINLKIQLVTRAIHELTREVLGCEEGEAVVVNFAFKLYRVPDESVSMENLRDELLRRMKGLSPRAVTLVEQDMNGNTAPFLHRVNEVCASYGALFDSFDATRPRDNPDRCRVEEGLGRKMANAVACEGRERVERPEVFGKWRARMSMAGFKMKALGQSVVESMRARLSGNPGFTVKEENGGVGFGWNGRSLTVASAWR